MDKHPVLKTTGKSGERKESNGAFTGDKGMAGRAVVNRVRRGRLGVIL